MKVFYGGLFTLEIVIKRHIQLHGKWRLFQLESKPTLLFVLL